MHNTAFRVMEQNAIYLAFETKDIEGCVKGMRALGIKGLSVTLPYKEAVIPYLDEVDSMAERIGAVNTIVNNHGCLVGYNTDASGALKALEEVLDLSGRTCLIIGAGGAARAIAFILKEHGVQITIANRSLERGEGLARNVECSFVPLKDLVEVEADILIQTTPIGMYPMLEQCVISSVVFQRGMVVMDIIYNPLETRFLKLAKTKGCRTISGLTMFINQGAEQLRLWLGTKPPVAEMVSAVKRALDGNGA
jgi:shikimate dehydrogenase